MESASKADLRDSLAAERTFLAWIRTGLALTGFGFVVARFGPYLREFQIGSASGDLSHGMSLLFGTVLIAVGVVVYLLSAWHHFKLVQELERGAPPPSRPSIQAIVIAAFLALVGVGMAIYLISIRHSANMHVGSNEEVPMVPAVRGIVSKPSNHAVDETVEKLANILKSKSVTLFALVDHSGEAQRVGTKMPPTKLLIFGNPKAGTPLMLAAPTSAIDLPLKILVAEDSQGKVWVSYNSPEYLAERHGLSRDLLQNIAVVETLAERPRNRNPTTRGSSEQ